MESAARLSENAEKKNQAKRQKKNRISRETDSVLSNPTRWITLSSSERVQAGRNLPEQHA